MSIYNGLIKPTGSDTPISFYDRIHDGFNELPDGNSAVFCHSGIVKFFLSETDYHTQYLGNLGMVMVEFDDIAEPIEITGVFNGFEHH
jgi:hypothetical protein